ncbi:aldo/keto reductase [Paludisphaera mucosa]|uniref:Aldo/keto reductase n=1 Tax=Paludisphaera mucosa TaxID=3030827 RepID=A0ABT6FBT0_9BACT|nr:aldo/keto reductase [Paludisphaera mucosa]MDG3005063.1 aldo/keto reductase [Paludisphaera mucosa]
MDLSRRQFIQAAAAGAAVAPAMGAGAAGKLPTRAFGKTGLEVSIIGFGSGSRFLMYDDEKALEALTRALELGITYIDTANGYGDGKSEERIGRILPAWRDKVTVATKLGARKGDDARRQLEASLKRLKTDHLDVVHIHALSGDEDLARIEAADGVLKALYEARDQKVVRAVGISCHAAPATLKTALERHDFDATQMALNAAMARMADAKGGMKATPMAEGSFEELALPVAVRKGLGVIAMKVFAQEQILGAAPVEKLMAYALSLPVSLASLGMPKLEFIDRNIEIARAFAPMPADERKRLSDSIATERKAAVVEFFRDHRDA